ncbi:MAG: hypothetical protein K0U84_24640 [Actinomycetia bacterium]|nr:hypothetical protein [Actinomycetes bacterium]
MTTTEGFSVTSGADGVQARQAFIGTTTVTTSDGSAGDTRAGATRRMHPDWWAPSAW